jgi:Na+-driven multidrug efflux pump
VAQCLGGGRRDAADAVARAALGASTWMGVLTALPALLLAAPLMQGLNAPAEVLQLAAPFLQALAPAMVLDAWNASMSTVLRTHLRTREALAVVVAMHAVHLAGALVLMPTMGLAGYALALCASRVFGIAVHLVLWRRLLGLHVQLSDAWRLRRAELAEVVRIGLPGAAENVAWRLAFMVSVSVAGTMGAAALATQAYVQQLGYLVVMASLAIGLSVEILVGHLVGAGRLHAAHRLVRRALAVGLALSLLLAVTLALAGPWLLRLFTQDAHILATGALLLWWTVLLEPGRTFNLVVINALRAAGDARYPVMAGAASMVVVLAGGSWLLGEVLGLGLVGVWIAYAADEWLRGLLMWRRWAHHGWVPHARAAHRRQKPLA